MNYQKGMFKEFSIQFTRVYTHKDFQIAAKLSAMEPLFDASSTTNCRRKKRKRALTC